MESKESYNSQLVELLKNPSNNRCIDCNIPNTQWTSKTFGIFLCFDCTSIHRSFGVNISFVKSVNMDKWSQVEYLFMKLGGNEKFTEFLEKHNLQNKECNVLYYDPLVKKYGEKLKSRVYEELGLCEEEYSNLQNKRNSIYYSTRFYEPKTIANEESFKSKLYDKFSIVYNSFISGVKQVTNKTVEYGGKFGKSIIIPSAKIIRSSSENLSSLWRSSPAKENGIEKPCYRFEDDDIEDMSKWD